MTTSEKPAISKVSEFLAKPETAVVDLLKEERLFRVMVDEYRRRGVTVYPKLKNNIQTLIRKLEGAVKAASEQAAAQTTDDPAPATARPRTAPSDATTTIMFTDIVSSSELTQSLGDRASREVFGVHNELVRRQTADYDGYEIKSMGDGFMLAFGSARRGVACAAAIQRELARLREVDDVPGVRIGLSVGEPIEEEGDLFGMSVITAARVSACAGADQILVSELVHGLVISSGDFKFSPVEPVALKGIEGVQKLYELQWDGAAEMAA